jgi:hypothetical protein
MMIVTTRERPSPEERSRALDVAARCGARFVARRGALGKLLADADASLAYVIARDRERLDDGQRSLFVHQGLLAARLMSGDDHPLIRAMLGQGPRPQQVIDGTLGLGIDALHLAAALGAEVIGVEAAPAICCLNEEGLRRLASTGLDAAARVRPVQGLAGEVMAAMAPDSADAVFLAPMFDEPAAAAPGWDLLRPLACYHPVDQATVDAALRVAPRLVVKLAPKDVVPDALAGARWVSTQALRYAVLER